jgi:hypothetical protein
LPDELDHAPPPAPEPPPVAAAPAPAPPPLPAPLAAEERARYRIEFGLLGQVGEATLALTPPGPGVARAKLSGEGRGAVLGMGATHKRIETEWDLAPGGSHRWTSLRVQGGVTVTHLVHQHVPGSVTIDRHQSGRPDGHDVLVRRTPVLDPLGLVMRLRVAPPRTRESFEVLDGRNLWSIAFAPAVRDGKHLRLEGEARPVYWNGEPDPDRIARQFTLLLTDDALHTPVRLVVPVGIGDVRVELTSVERASTVAAARW